MGTGPRSAGLKAAHPLGLRGLVKIYNLISIYKEKRFWFSVIVGIIGVSLAAIVGIDMPTMVGMIADAFFSVLPSILGITLAGYALIVGFGNPDFVRKASTPSGRRGFSYQQRTNAVFGMAIIVQTAVLVTVLLVKLAMPIAKNVPVPGILADATNGVVSFILLSFGLYSLLLIIDTVISIFNYGQTVHFVIRLEEDRARDQAPTAETTSDAALVAPADDEG